jgi:hypothetical protein
MNLLQTTAGWHVYMVGTALRFYLACVMNTFSQANACWILALAPDCALSHLQKPGGRQAVKRLCYHASQHTDCTHGAGQHTPRATQTHGGFGIRHFVRRFLGEYFPFTYQRRLANAVVTFFGVTGLVIHNNGFFRHDLPVDGFVPRFRLILLPSHPIPASSLGVWNVPASAFSIRRSFLPIPGSVCYSF